MALDAEVKKMQAAGVPVVSLGVGEPDFATPTPISNAAKQALDEGFTHYTASAGITELKQAIADKLKEENNCNYTTEEIIINPGSKFSLYLTFQVLCNPGDEVLIPTPTWSTYIEQVKMTGATPVLIPLSAPFKLTATDLEKYASPKIKAILLNTPSNPTGAVIDPAELEKIAELAVSKNWWIITDEIYEKIIYSNKHLSVASLSPEIKAKTITINGFSKAYAMTGWRLGYTAASKEIISAMNAIQSQTTSNACSIAQKAALGAFTPETETTVQAMVKEFTARRQLVLDHLSPIKKLGVTAPEGAFYFFVSIEKLLGNTYPTSAKWCEALLTEKKVAVVPGEAFAAPGYFRLSFACSRETLQKGLQGITQFIQD